MLVNIIKTYRDIITICDSDLIGKKFQQEKFQLNIKKSFYNGKETSEEETIKIMNEMEKEDATFNIVGEKSVQTALKQGTITKENIKEIKGIPFALILL